MDGILYRKVRHANNEKRKIRNDAMNTTNKLRKNQNARRIANLQILRDNGSGHHQTSGGKRKN